MKDKIFIIKNILKIIISILIIISLTKSCSSAFSYDDFIQHSYNVANSGANNYTKGACSWFYNKASAIRTFLINNNINPDDYNCYFVRMANTGNTLTSNNRAVILFNSQESSSFNSWTGQIPITNYKDFVAVGVTNTNGDDYRLYTSISAAIAPTNNQERKAGLIELTSYQGISWSYYWNNAYFSIVVSDRNISNNTTGAIAAEAVIGNNYYSNDYYFVLQEYSNNEWINKQELVQNATSLTYGYDIILQFTGTTGLTSGGDYRIIYTNGTTNRVTSEQFKISIITPEPEEPSGDTSGDNGGIGYCTCGPYLIKIIDILSGDIYGQIVENGQIVNGTLDQIRNQLESNNEAIQELKQAMFGSGESGESGEKKNFLEKTYEKMFTLSSGDITEIIEGVRNDIQIDSGEIQAENIILEFIKGEPGDFVISWNKYSPTLSVKGQRINTPEDFIPSGEINFSKIERENEALQTTMNWTRTITTWSLIGICIHQGWLILMAMLGVGTAIYGDVKEEKEKLKKQGDNKK